VSFIAALQKAAIPGINLPKGSCLYRAYKGMTEKPLFSVSFVAMDNYTEI